MKKKEIQELLQKPVDELRKLLAEHHEELRVLRFDHAQGKVKNIRRIREVRKVIARILTRLAAERTQK